MIGKIDYNGKAVNKNITAGKEKVFLEIAKTLDLKFWAETSKRKILDNLDDPMIEQHITAIREDAKIHVIPNGQISFKVRAHIFIL